MTARTTTGAPDLWRAIVPPARKLGAMTLMAAVLLAVVTLKMIDGPGTHPTIHRLVMQWGMVSFSVLAIGSAVLQGRALRLLPPAGDAGRFWWAWTSAGLAVAAVMWICVQLLNSPIGQPYCISFTSDSRGCGPHPLQLWAAAIPAAGASVLGMALAVIGVVALARQRAQVGTLIGPAMVFTGMAGVGFASAVVGYALSSSFVPPLNVGLWILFAGAGGALVVEVAAIWWFLRGR